MTSRVRASAFLLLLAVLFTCVLSTAVFSGEHPWDSDQHPDSVVAPPPVEDTVRVVVGTARPGGGSTTTAVSGGSASVDWVNRLLFKVAWAYAQRNYHPARSHSMQTNRW